MKKTTRLLLGKETPLPGERDVVADSEGTNEVCAAGSPVMAAPLWLAAEDEEESVGCRRRCWKSGRPGREELWLVLKRGG